MFVLYRLLGASTLMEIKTASDLFTWQYYSMLDI